MSTTQQHHERFATELARLNTEQRAAVDHTEGPVLVIAGPGTGKTHILASRIGQILLTTDTAAQNILCLTYTEAGVRAMRERLLQLIGPEAHRVHIFTFHSFCNTVIQDNLVYFGSQGLEPITELEQIALTRSLLEQLPVDHPLRRGKVNLYFYERHLRWLFQMMKTEGWTVAELNEKIDSYLTELPERPEYRYKQSRKGKFQKGDLKVAQYEAQVGRMKLLRAAVALFDGYENGLRTLRRYDYADMILWVLKAFRENDLLLRRYQEQYLYFLIDEYQDTNGAQNELIRLLAAYWERPNLFIVGDDDQSIFEFQGARLKNLVDYYDAYRDDIFVVLLRQNYRSTQAVLDAAKAVIDANEQRIIHQLHNLGIDKDLSAALPARQQSAVVPEVRCYPNTFQENIAVLQSLRAQHAAGIPWREMAVIYARHKQVAELQDMLDKEGIPYQARRRTNVLDSVLVRQLREMLLYLRDEQQRSFSGDHRLFKLLHYRCFGIAPLSIAQLATKLAKIPYDQRPSWREWLQQPEHWPEELKDAGRLVHIGQWWEHLIGQLQDTGLPNLVEQILNGSGLLRQALQANDRLWQVQVAKTFLDFVREEVARRPRLSLMELLTVLDQMDSNRLALPLRKEIELEDGVQLVTAHSSKGLEFTTVYVLDATQKGWEGSRSGNGRFVLPDTLTLSGGTFEDETRRRLFYVALTRAKQYLFVSYADQNADGKPQMATRFLDELLQTPALELMPTSIPQAQLLEHELSLLQQVDRPHLPQLERSAVAQLLEGFAFSPSSWTRYLDCPLRFFYEVVLQAPQIQRPAAAYGNAMHNALQRYFNLMLGQEEKQFGVIAQLVDLFTEELTKVRSYFTPEVFERKLAQGQHNLQLYYEQHRATWTTHCRTEMRIQQVEVEDVPLKGVLDRVDLLDEQNIRIVDYKTGSQDKKKVAPPKGSDLLSAGNYWRQLAFYKLLWEARGGEGRRVQSAAINYLEVDKNGQLSIQEVSFTTEAMRLVKKALSDSYQQVLDQQFYTGCGEANCEWCNFVSKDMQPPSHTSESIEALDERMG